LQTALHAKAKESPNFRFYALYDKVYRKDVLAFAYERCKANGGVAGVDGQTFEDIEAYGVERWLDELMQELKNRTYQPLPVRRVYIPKPDGKQRPLARIMHIFKDNKSLFCYKHVVKTMFAVTKEASECLKIAQHSVCCSQEFFASL
jgi:hypothetical protein